MKVRYHGLSRNGTEGWILEKGQRTAAPFSRLVTGDDSRQGAPVVPFSSVVHTYNLTSLHILYVPLPTLPGVREARHPSLSGTRSS
jgi:hypothetical protein